ncbi:MAG: monofunctional biosynthetic peptidoglycan transglycosylase [bacterium]|nr:monofunctional biosynthetic peptidoglycan transglycosylase [bacterium]MCP5069957.1 monofunctional biosynthetic peptidoglycan transglycosylase [bacterium]
MKVARNARRRKGRRTRRPSWKKLVGVFALRLSAGAVAILLLLILPWRWIPPPTSAYMLRAHKDTPGGRIEQRWVPWEEISPHVAVAVLAAEDQRFPIHHGFDWRAIGDAIQDDSGRLRGASTLSQQLAKNLYLWPARSWLRKALEAVLTTCLEATWPKKRILEVYLNVAEFGPGVFGVEAAANRYFGTSAAQLNPRQAALLAAVLPSPKQLSAASPSIYVRTRAGGIHEAVRKLGGTPFLKQITVPGR